MVTRTRRTRQRPNRSRKLIKKKSKTKRRSRNTRKKHKSIKGGGSQTKLIKKIWDLNIRPLLKKAISLDMPFEKWPELEHLDNPDLVDKLILWGARIDRHKSIAVFDRTRSMSRTVLIQTINKQLPTILANYGMSFKLPHQVKNISSGLRRRSVSRRSSSRRSEGLSDINQGGGDFFLGVILGAAALGVFFLKLLVGLIQCCADDKDDDAEMGSLVSTQQNNRKLTNKELQERLPEFANMTIKEEDECAICLESLGVAPPGDDFKQMAPVILSCGHKFHYGCVKTWADQVKPDGGCPTCRALFSGLYWSQIGKGEATEDSPLP
mgnify:FL=1